MSVQLYILMIFAGLAVGFFLDWLVSQMPREEKWNPPGNCPECGAGRNGIRGWLPILRHLGAEKCTQCGHVFGRQGILMELTTTVLFLVVVQAFGLEWKTLWYLLIVAALIPISAIDVRYQVIPDSLLVFGLLPMAGLWFTTYSGEIGEFLIGGVVLGGGLWMISIIGKKIYKQEVMGFGDVKFAGWMGLILGWQVGLISMLLGFVLATVVFLTMMAFGKVRFRQEVPFGQFLAGGMFLGMLFGEMLLNWYLTTFVFI
ncbi:MAG: A24 family peptidase [Lentisphaeria bacterium]|nr:A24 family peptidase [Candidatus Neomarinimicrobiota bacterium]MCF7841752.1 A24 family peptidase [Lentisphaeria bacterium]